MHLTLTIPPPTPAPPTRAACEAAVRLGVTLPDLDQTPAPLTFHLELNHSTRLLITGPSGSGKTRLLHTLEHTLRENHVRVIRPIAAPTSRRRAARSVLDAVLASPANTPSRLDEAMRALASVGLSEAHIMARRVSELSAGQLERLRLARALSDADRAAINPGAAILIDEFGATLDDDALRAVARLLRRAAHARPNLTLAIATHRPAIVREELAPTHDIDLARMPPVGRASSLPLQSSLIHQPKQLPPHITEGTTQHLELLSQYHYRTRPPATIDRVFTATDPTTRQPIAVLALSRPTLNAAWRRFAWPDRYSTTDKRLNAQRLNSELRCISRVIVAPNHRALGVARALVAHALQHAPTPNIEALAAMGASCSIFRAAGMTEFPVPIQPADARLLDFLTDLRLQLWRLATPHETYERLTTDRSIAAQLERELSLWSTSSRATRATRRAGPEALFTKACRRLARTPRAYAWSSPT
ncbi:MAG: GNAT family N-acetyltransferase [Phycisphaerales bacterium]